MKNKIKLVLCDIEGTLTSKGGRGFCHGLDIVFKKLMNARTEIGLMSGRDAGACLQFHRLFDLNGPIIAENGSVLYINPRINETKKIELGKIDEKTKNKIRKKLKNNKTFWEDPLKKYILTFYPNSYPGQTRADVKKIYAVIKRKLEKISDIEVFYTSTAVDIAKKNVSKCSAAKHYMKTEKIKPNEVAILADSMNDFGIANFIGTNGGFVCVPNDADGNLKRIANYVSRRNSPQAACDILRKLSK